MAKVAVSAAAMPCRMSGLISEIPATPAQGSGANARQWSWRIQFSAVTSPAAADGLSLLLWVVIKSSIDSNGRGGSKERRRMDEVREGKKFPKSLKVCCFWGKSPKQQEALSWPRWPTLEYSSHSTNPRHCDLYSTSHCSLWVSDILPMNLQLLLFFLVAEEEEGWRIFGLWQLLWQSSPAHTSSLWCNTPPGSAGEGSCSSHSCGYTESPRKTVVTSQQTISTATFKPKKQRIHYRDTKGMLHMCFTIPEGCRHEERGVTVH